METDLLKKKLEEKTKQLKNICSDAKFADKLIEDILSLKGQIDVEPTRLYVRDKDVIEEIEGDTFSISVTTKGALFHLKGGYDILVSAGFKGLYETLANYVSSRDAYEAADEETKNNYDLIFSVMTYILELPLYAFTGDDDFMFKLGTMCVQHLRDMTEKALNAELLPEDEEANRNFENSVMAAEEISEELKENEGK